MIGTEEKQMNNETGADCEQVTVDLGLLHRQGRFRGQQYPIQEELRRLPIDDPRIVFRAPERFGASFLNRQNGYLDVTLARHPTIVTLRGKLRMVKYEKECTAHGISEVF